jgi:hypothetical protein
MGHREVRGSREVVDPEKWAPDDDAVVRADRRRAAE